MAQAVSLWAFTPEARVRAAVSPCEELLWIKWYWYMYFRFTLSFHQCSTPVFMYTLHLPEGEKGRSLGTFHKPRSFGNQRALIKKNYFHFFFNEPLG